MDCLIPDRVWSYKNFNMGMELDIAGEFIYDGINALNQIHTIEEHATLFSFLYHISVGIERLQKIVVVLYENVNNENHEEFENKLRTHSHTNLNEWICKNSDLKLNPRENEFLHMLTSFYNSARYDRFNLDSQFGKEKEIFSKFLLNQFADIIEYHFFDDSVILITSHVKEMLGRIVGSLSNKYYNLVHEGCNKAHTFTYEIRADSKAEKVFLSTYKKHSLQMQKVTEKIAFKELLIYLRNTKDKHGLLHYIDDIDSLEFDPALVNEYINDISNGSIPQTLVDEVETLYQENNYKKDRHELVDVIGNTRVDFDIYLIHLCCQMMDNLVNKQIDCLKFADDFIRIYEIIDEDYGCDILDNIAELCKKVSTSEITSEKFISQIKSALCNLKELYNF